VIRVIQIQRSGRNEEGDHRKEIDGEVPAVLEVVGGAVPAIVELCEDDDDVQFGVAKAMAKRRLQNLPAAVLGGGWRLALRQ
jgi:hypothetical protein